MGRAIEVGRKEGKIELEAERQKSEAETEGERGEI